MENNIGIKISACALAVSCAFPAAAQAPADGIQEVVITASKRKEGIQSVPMSVDAITGESLLKMNVQKFEEVEKLSPGLVLNPADGRGQNVSLRGVTFDPDTGASPTVQVYWNETPISTSDAFRAMFDIGRIEVLRGPQGTLRGQTSPAGAITIGTARPELDMLGGRINQTFGSRSQRNTQLAVNLPVIQGKLAVRVAGLADDTENGVHNVSNGSDNHDRARGARVSVLYQPVKSVELLLVHQRLNNRNVNYPIVNGRPVAGQAAGPALDADDRTAVAEGKYEFHNDTRLTSLNAGWDLGSHRLSYIGGFQRSKEDDDRDLDQTNVIAGFQYRQLVKIDSLQRTHELRFESSGPAFWNYMVGAYYSYGKASSGFSQPYAYFFPAPYAVPMSVELKGYSAPGADGRSTALFTDHRFALTPADELELGLRMQKTRSYNQQYLSVFGAVSASLPEALASQRQSAWTGSASYKHTLGKDAMVYASYAGGFRPGGAASFITAQGLDARYVNYKEEKSNSLELGIKSKLFERRVTFNADVFQQRIKNYIGRANGVYARVAAIPGEPAGPGPGGTYQADLATGPMNLNTNGDVLSRGIEMSAAWLISPSWRANLAASYINAHYDGASLYCNDSNNDGLPDSGGTGMQPGRQVSECKSDRPLADSYGNEPGKLSMALQSEYSRSLGKVDGFIRGMVRYVAPAYNQQIDHRIGSYTPVDLYLGVRSADQHWELSLWSQNLFDRSVDRGRFAYYQGAVAGGYARTPLREERKVGVTLRYDFEN
ncbi:TonB-dependent receptor [Oxalobacteraceae bacterium OTU3REALA1]|nr:TonB-dependent receptor [Oxalobacteraceae bacterium OTU3REALA1]